MFNQSELNSAASAIAGAYRLVNFACTSQTPGEWDNNTFLECDAILLKFRCYHKGRELSLSCTPNPVPGFSNPQERTIPVFPVQAINLLPIGEREMLTEQEKEEELIRQIESALMCTIANLEEKEQAEACEAGHRETQTMAARTSENAVSAAESHRFETGGCSVSKSTRPSVRKLRNLQRLVSDVTDDDDALQKQFGRVLLNIFLQLFNNCSARNQIRLVSLLDGAAHLSYEFGLKKESLDLHQHAASLKHNWWGRKHINRAFNLDSIARICSEFGEFEKAETSYMESETLLEIYQQNHTTSMRKLQLT